MPNTRDCIRKSTTLTCDFLCFKLLYLPKIHHKKKSEIQENFDLTIEYRKRENTEKHGTPT